MRWTRWVFFLACTAGFPGGAGAQGKCGPEGAGEGPKLTEKERRAIQSAADALAAQGPKGVAALAAKLCEKDEAWKAAALEALRHLGPDAAPALEAVVAELKGGDGYRRGLALMTLRAIGPKAKAALPALTEAAKETQDFKGSFAAGFPSTVADGALDAVRAIDPDALPRLAEAMIPGLLRVAAGKEEGPAASALALLHQLGPHAKPALPKLKELLPTLPARSANNALPVFLAAGEQGMALLADAVLDAKTGAETKIALMQAQRWESRTTPSALRILRALLQDKVAAVRAAAARALQTVRAGELIPDLAALLPDADLLDAKGDRIYDDPYCVAGALGHQGKEAVPALTKALGHEAPLARFQAARALALVGKEARAAAEPLERLLDDRVPLIEIEAAKALLAVGAAGDKARARLEKHLKADSRLLVPALEAVNDLGPAGLPAFTAVKRAALESTEFRVQKIGFDALSRMGADPKEVVRAWAQLLKGQAKFIHFAPREQLRTDGKEARDVLPLLEDFLKKLDVNGRRRTTEALAAMGPAASAAVPALIKALGDESFVAGGAMDALAEMGDAARPAVAPLVRRFESIGPGDPEAAYHKREVLRTLARLGPVAVEAVPRLMEWVAEFPEAARALGRVGPAAKAAVPLLEKTYGGEPGNAKTWAAYALVKVTGKTRPYVSGLAETVQQAKDPARRGEAIEALGELGPDARDALPALLQAMKSKVARGPLQGDLRLAAARVLAHFGAAAKQAVPDLIDMLKDGYPPARSAAVETLGAIGPDARAAIPALERLAEELPHFRRVVEHALTKIRAK